MVKYIAKSVPGNWLVRKNKIFRVSLFEGRSRRAQCKILRVIPVGGDPRRTMMLLRYCEAALHCAQYKILDDGTWFAEIDGFQGLWGNGATVESCRKDLLEALEDWLMLKLADGDPIPAIAIDGMEIKVS